MLLDIIIKSIVGWLIIGVVSTIAQKQPTIGAFIMGIPIVTFITLIIMYYFRLIIYYYPVIINDKLKNLF